MARTRSGIRGLHVGGPNSAQSVLREALTLKVTYDHEVGVPRILLSNVPIEERDEDKPGLIFDYDKDGNVVDIEVLDASKRVENPSSVECAVTG